MSFGQLFFQDRKMMSLHCFLATTVLIFFFGKIGKNVEK